MSIERAEKLKEALTDKFVVVDADVPELRRFQNWTGKVKTVNMNCRALVEFDGPVDISWYDIDPDFLKVVDAPMKKAAAPAAKAAAPAEAKAAPKPAAAAAGKSPLDAIRAQQAAKAAGGAAPAAAPAAGGAKLSPLDMIRKQQAAKAAGGAAPAEVAAAPAPAPVAETPAAPEPAPAAPAAPKPLPTTGPDGKPLSKLDMIRMQGAKKNP